MRSETAPEGGGGQSYMHALGRAPTSGVARHWKVFHEGGRGAWDYAGAWGDAGMHCMGAHGGVCLGVSWG